jgi:hypothetical protein
LLRATVDAIEGCDDTSRADVDGRIDAALNWDCLVLHSREASGIIQKAVPPWKARCPETLSGDRTCRLKDFQDKDLQDMAC